MSAKTESAVERFIASTRSLFAEEKNIEARWGKLGPMLRELLADPSLKAQSKKWPACVQRDRAENLLFYEDPDFGFVINGLVKAPNTRTQIHDHAHNWTLYGVLDGNETIERYERLDNKSKPDYAEVCPAGNFRVKPGGCRSGPSLADSRRRKRGGANRSDHRPEREGGGFSSGSIRCGEQKILAGIRTAPDSL